STRTSTSSRPGGARSRSTISRGRSTAVIRAAVVLTNVSLIDSQAQALRGLGRGAVHGLLHLLHGLGLGEDAGDVALHHADAVAQELLAERGLGDALHDGMLEHVPKEAMD